MTRQMNSFKQRYSLYFLTFILLVVPAYSSSGMGTVVIDSMVNEIAGLENYLQILEDSTHKLTINQVIHSDYQSKFKPAVIFSEELSPKNTYWGKIVLKSELDRDSDWVLVLEDYWPISYVEAYITYDNQTFEVKKAGKLTPTPELDIKEGRFNKLHVFLPKNREEAAIFLKIRNVDHRPIGFTLKLENNISWFKKQEINNILQAIFHGILWVMIIYNFSMYISVGDKAYLYYVLYMVLLSMYALYYMGYLKTYFIGNHTRVNDYVWVISAYAPSVFYFLFARYYFRIKGRLPLTDWLIKTWVAIKSTILVVFLLILFIFYNTKLVGTMGSYLMLFEIGLYVVSLIYVIHATTKAKTKNAIYFIFGTSILLTSTVVFILNILIKGQGNYLILQAGIIIELIFFSFGLADRMKLREIKVQKSRERLIEQLQENERLQTEVNRQLEEKVKERTQKISRQKEEISQKNEELVALNEEKNYLIGIVAHDLGNPLANIKLYAQLIKRTAEKLSEKHINQLNIIEDSTENMMDMISKILDVNAIEAHKIKMNMEEVNLSSILNATIDELREKAENKNLSIYLDTSSEEAKVDKFYAKQTFDNLISNAIKFSEPGKRIHIVVKKKSDKVRVEIKDEGPGICADDMKKIFRKYQKLSAKPTGGERSTGLGLSIVKKYVELMQGKVWCESEPGSGSTFFIEFDKAEKPVVNKV